MRLIKKYSNRRLYDTETSGYITLDELAEIIRGGSDVRVVGAKSGEDLTRWELLFVACGMFNSVYLLYLLLIRGAMP